MKRSNLFTRIVPFVLLSCCAVEAVIYDITYYEEIQLILSQIFGFGIIGVSKEFYLSVKYRACLYTPIACVGLALLTVVNTVFLSLKLYYTITISDSTILKMTLERNDNIGTYYDCIVILVFIFIASIFLVKEEIFCKL